MYAVERFEAVLEMKLGRRGGLGPGCLALGLVAAACGVSTSNGAPCADDDTRECLCDTGDEGTQTCEDGGPSWAECQCDWGSGGSGASGGSDRGEGSGGSDSNQASSATGNPGGNASSTDGPGAEGSGSGGEGGAGGSAGNGEGGAGGSAGNGEGGAGGSAGNGEGGAGAVVGHGGAQGTGGAGSVGVGGDGASSVGGVAGNGGVGTGGVGTGGVSGSGSGGTGTSGDCDVVVARAPGWGSSANYELTYAELHTNWADYGTCTIEFLDLPDDFTLASIVGLNAGTLWVGDPAGAFRQYTAGELQAISDWVSEGGGLVTSYLLRLESTDSADNGAVFPHLGIDDDEVSPMSVATTVSANHVTGHAVLTRVENPFNLASYVYAQVPVTNWTSALLPSAAIVAQTDNGLGVVITRSLPHRSVYVSMFPEYQATSNRGARQLVYNAAIWTAGHDDW